VCVHKQSVPDKSYILEGAKFKGECNAKKEDCGYREKEGSKGDE
jgi:hypothetical protein